MTDIQLIGLAFWLVCVGWVFVVALISVVLDNATTRIINSEKKGR